MTIVIIFGILMLIAGGMSRGRRTIVEDNDNRHLFDNPSKPYNPNITKDGLRKQINVQYELHNYKETKRLCQEFVYYYNEDMHVLFLLSMADSQLGNFAEAEKHAETIMYRFDNFKLGYYIKGCSSFNKGNPNDAKKYFERAVESGLPREWISQATNNEIII